MKNLAIIFVFICCSIGTHASEIVAHYDSIYSLGNQAFQEAQFEEALSFYNSILESGLESADLYFNVANTHFKMGQNTLAILHFERAIQLNPNGENIQYNLGLATDLIVDKIERINTPFYITWWQTLINALPIDTFAWLSIIFTSLGMGSLLWFLKTQKSTVKRFMFYLFMVFLVGAATSYLFANSQYWEHFQKKEAIVFATRTNIYSAPNTTSTVLFIVHDGLKVKVLNEQQQWLNIVLPDGSIGWIPEEAVVVI